MSADATFTVASGSDFTVSDGNLKCGVAGIYLVSARGSFRSSGSGESDANLVFSGNGEVYIPIESGGTIEFIAEMSAGDTLGANLYGSSASISLAVSLVRIK